MKAYKLIPVVVMFLYCSVAAQSKRSLVNNGVDHYKNGKYADAEVNFKKSLEKDPDLFQGHFNLGDAYYKQGRYDEALREYKNSLSFTKNKNDEAKVFHNIGNSLLKSQKYKESIGAYANALKLNPNDLETKYNLSYALDMMKQNQNQQKQNQNQDNKDQNKDQKQNQQQKNDQNKQNKDQKKQNQQQQQQQQKNQISKEEAQRILNALKNDEKEIQKKLRKMKGKPVATEKDW